MEAYSPIAHGKALKSSSIVSMAKKYGVSIPQLCVKYILQLGLAALPKASTPEHMRDNANLDFEISAEDIGELEMLDFKEYGEHRHFPVFSGK